MVDVVYYQKDLTCFDIQVLYCFINLRSSIILSPFSGDIYLYLGVSLSGSIFSASFVTVSEFIETLVMIIVITDQSLVAGTVF